MTSLDFRPAPGAAPTWRMVLSQAALEFRTTLRNGEQILLTLVIPLVLLIGLTLVPVLDLGTERRVDAITPGILALAVMSTAFTGQAISTGFERRYGALKLLGATPLSRAALITAKTLAVLAVEVVQVVLIVAVALLLGWHPQGSPVAAALLLVLGTAAFSALGLALAGLLRAEATLAAANGIYVLLLLGGGVVIAPERLPPVWSSVAGILPSGALADGLRSVLLHGAAMPWAAAGILVLWAVAGAVVALRTFRWE